MPRLDEITYSRNTVIAAIQDFYAFLTKMYLKDSAVVQPPAGGWPSITRDNLSDFYKTDEVFTLLRYLPYIVEPEDPRDKAESCPSSYFTDWQFHAQTRVSAASLTLETEGPDFTDDLPMPSHLVGLTDGGGDHDIFLLDTKLGIVLWSGCPGEIRYSPTRELVEDDVFDYIDDEKEANWRCDAPAWAVADFFELLKDQFRLLHWIPFSPRRIVDTYAGSDEARLASIAMVQKIYREHGWPDLERYRKDECLAAIRKALEEQYPQDSDWRDDE